MKLLKPLIVIALFIAFMAGIIALAIYFNPYFTNEIKP